MKPIDFKELLFNQIDLLDISCCSKYPGRDFSRSLKLPFAKLTKCIIQMEGRSLGKNHPRVKRGVFN